MNALIADTATSEDSEPCNQPYCIGDPEDHGAGVGLRIDPENQTVVLNNGDGDYYEDFGAEGSRGWEITMRDRRMDIFTVTEGLDQESQIGIAARVENLPKSRDESTRIVKPAGEMPRIEGEKLLKRIQEFGSH